MLHDAVKQEGVATRKAKHRFLQRVGIAVAKRNFTVLNNANQPWRPPRPAALLVMSQLLRARCGPGHAAARPNNRRATAC